MKEKHLYEVGDVVLIGERLLHHIKESNWPASMRELVGTTQTISSTEESRTHGSGYYTKKGGWFIPQDCIVNNMKEIEIIYKVDGKEYSTIEEAREEIVRENLRQMIKESQDPIFYQEKITREDVIDYLLDNVDDIHNHLTEIKRYMKIDNQSATVKNKSRH